MSDFWTTAWRIKMRLYTSGLQSVAGLSLPDFLGIGAMKSGTTWLFQNLQCHPDLYLPKHKELHYFNRNFHKSLKAYAQKFEPGKDKIKGEITPGYSILTLEQIGFIKTVMPNVKLIFLMRNPIDRAWSQALMDLVTIEKREFESVKDDEFYAHFAHQRSVLRSDYRTILRNWMSVFPEQRFFLGFFEDVRDRPTELLKSVFQHLGASTELDWSRFPYNRVAHAGLGIVMPEKYREVLRTMYCAEIESLYEFLGEPVRKWRCS